MGLFSRSMTLLRAKVNDLLDRAEDPRQTLEYSYERQRELLQQVRRGLVEVATSKVRLEMQAGKLRDSIPKVEDQARRALAAGREDLARVALQRKQVALTELTGLEQQINEVLAEEQKLSLAEQRMQAKMEAFRTRREVVSARYTAAEAQVRIGEALSGVSEELADVGLALERAEDKTQKLQARASAIDSLVESGVLEDMSLPSGDVVERELTKIGAASAVDDELAAMRRELGAPPPTPQLGSGS
jgi:phage shock protein A